MTEACSLDAVPSIAASIDALVEKLRGEAARSGRRADADGAFDFAEAAFRLKQGYRRLGALRAEIEAAQSAAASKQKKWLRA